MEENLLSNQVERGAGNSPERSQSEEQNYQAIAKYLPISPGTYDPRPGPENLRALRKESKVLNINTVSAELKRNVYVRVAEWKEGNLYVIAGIYRDLPKHPEYRKTFTAHLTVANEETSLVEERAEEVNLETAYTYLAKKAESMEG
jgi:hypothetical protein